MSEMDSLRQADAHYKGIVAFERWLRCDVNVDRLQRYSSKLQEHARNATPELLAKARNVAKRAAAIETGAIEHLYPVDRGFTFTVATEAAMWEAAYGAKDQKTRALIEAQLAAYDFVMDLVTRETPVTEAWIRQLHTELCKSQETYKAYTEVGLQDLPLPLGQYKTLPNHVRKQDGKTHSYAPVHFVAEEMHKLVVEINGQQFNDASCIHQAAYVHHSLTVIHPFADGNCRVARALASVFTYRAHTVPLLIFAESQAEYFSALAMSDTGSYEEFCQFVEDRLLESLLFVQQSLETAQTPSPAEMRAKIGGLFRTPGGYTQAQVDQAGLKLHEALFKELTAKATEMSSDSELMLNVSPMKGPYDREDRRPDYRHLPEGLRLSVSFGTAKPVEASYQLNLGIEVPRNAAKDDEILIVNAYGFSGSPFSARIGDILPTIRASLQMRLIMFTETVLSHGLANLYPAALRNVEPLLAINSAQGESHSEPLTASISGKDWLDLRYRFEQLQNLGVGARFTASDGEETWQVDGGKTRSNTLDVEVLCRHAGMMLPRSRRVWKSIMDDLGEMPVSQSDHLRRWLYYLKSREGLEDLTHGESREGETVVESVFGRIVDLVGASIRACTDCATNEAEG
jgi:Fic family protein